MALARGRADGVRPDDPAGVADVLDQDVPGRARVDRKRLAQLDVLRRGEAAAEGELAGGAARDEMLLLAGSERGACRARDLVARDACDTRVALVALFALRAGVARVALRPLRPRRPDEQRARPEVGGRQRPVLHLRTGDGVRLELLRADRAC